MATKLNREGWRAFLAPFRWILIAGIAYFLSAGTTEINRAWIYFIFFIIGGFVLNAILLFKAPQLLNDRGRIKEGTQKRDKFYVIAYFMLSILIVPITAGLEYRYFGFSLAYEFLYLALFFYVLASVFSIWPMLYNRFFEGTIRLQKEKNHKVIDSGPYAYVRHPGYIAMIIGALPLPLALGSLYGLIPALLEIIIVVARTLYEDKFLQDELAGYKEYSSRVKYRLLPYIW